VFLIKVHAGGFKVKQFEQSSVSYLPGNLEQVFKSEF
jgi:hypothetical protein